MLIINLLPGHGITNIKGESYDPGATNKNGTQEAKGTEILAKKLKFKLEFNGFKVNLLNEKNVTAQINFVNNHKCDLAIALHFNAFNEKASGVEVLYSDIAPGFHQSTTLKFANILLNHLVKDTGMVNRGLKKTNSGVGIIKRTKYPTVLSENGFVDHPTEYLWAVENSKLEILADSHCKAVCEYFGVEYKIEDKNKENNNKEENNNDMAILNTKNLIKFTYNGEAKQLENFTINNTTYVKIRDILELFTKVLDLDSKNMIINIKDNEVKINVNDKEINGILINDKTYSPVRQLCEMLGKTVDYDGVNKKVIII